MKISLLLRSGLLVATICGAVSVAPFPLIRIAQAAPTKVPDSQLVTTKSIGPARLGRSVAALKRAFPGSVISLNGEQAESYTLKKNGRELVSFVTREVAKNGSFKLRDTDIVSSMWTSDPHFKTAKGIGPGSWLHNAVAIYGKPLISFSPHDESGIFPNYSNKLWFEPEAPRDPNSDYRVAGIYTAQELKILDGTTTRFKKGTRIVALGCSEKTYY